MGFLHSESTMVPPWFLNLYHINTMFYQLLSGIVYIKVLQSDTKSDTTLYHGMYYYYITVIIIYCYALRG